MPTAYPNARFSSDTARERVDESSLADAGFSSNKHDLPFSSMHPFQPGSHPRQCFLASDNLRSRICRALRRPRNGFTALDLMMLFRPVRDLTDEAIASTMLVVDE